MLKVDVRDERNIRDVMRGHDAVLSAIPYYLNYDMTALDYFDPRHHISAMMRTTGYSLSVTAQMQLDGRIAEHGVHAAYEVTPFEPYVAELSRRGIVVEALDGAARVT